MALHGTSSVALEEYPLVIVQRVGCSFAGLSATERVLQRLRKEGRSPECGIFRQISLLI